ncbi:hypothetical protein GCM10029992_13400 [Glycomyces albus]
MDQVDLVAAQSVTEPGALDGVAAVCGQEPPERCQRVLHLPYGGGGRFIVPENVGESMRGNPPTGLEQKPCQRLRLPAGQRDSVALVENLERPQYPKPHRPP